MAAKKPSDLEAEMKKLMKEVQKLRTEIDSLKQMVPTIGRAVSELARKTRMKPPRYSVTYAVTANQ
jgi:prefoldin subunit 5